jgi:CDP-glycerol glycerophosphotransferase (TagB/SpsB family)
MFGSSKEENNFSPIKYMSDIESNYKQAWTRLEGKADLFEPEEYGLLYYYLQTRDDSISNHIQELEWN